MDAARRARFRAGPARPGALPDEGPRRLLARQPLPRPEAQDVRRGRRRQDARGARPGRKHPAALREDLTVLQQGLPTVAEIRAFLEQAIGRDARLARVCAADPELPGRLVVAAQGLDLVEIERAVRALGLSGEAQGEEIVQALFESKRQLVGRSSIMEFVVNDTSPGKVGGMENLKHWMARREKAFGLEAITSGKRMPKGVLLMGVAGCGKSLFVKAIAAQWHLPLIRLDMAAVYEGTFGTPETSLRKAFRTAEAAAPCVLWIDEIEAGISTQGFKVEGGPARGCSARF